MLAWCGEGYDLKLLCAYYAETAFQKEILTNIPLSTTMTIVVCLFTLKADIAKNMDPNKTALIS